MAELKKRHEFWLALLIVVLFVGLAWRSDEFLTFGNLYDLANNYAMLTILACGLFVVLISGGIDISFPAMMVIALGLGFIFYSENQADGSGEWSCYEGSYVEVGGKRISDVKQIMPCIIETLEKAERVEKLAQERVEEIHRSEKEIEEKELLVSE